MSKDQVIELIKQYRDSVGKDRKPLRTYDLEDGLEIQAEERGILIACDTLISRIKRIEV